MLTVLETTARRHDLNSSLRRPDSLQGVAQEDGHGYYNYRNLGEISLMEKAVQDARVEARTAMAFRRVTRTSNR